MSLYRINTFLIMSKEKNYAKLNSECKLEIYTDNAVFVNNEVYTTLNGRKYEISGEDLLKIHGLLSDKNITQVTFREGDLTPTICKYVFIGQNVEKESIMETFTNILQQVEHINETRHWWERKIKITL